MGWKQFVASIVSSLVWPTIVLVVLLLFRNELRKVIQGLAHFKYKDLELDFEKVRQQAAAVQEEVPRPSLTPATPTEQSWEDQVLEAVEDSPWAAILLAWSGLETAIASAVARLAISPEPPSSRSPAHSIDMLASYAGLPQQIVSVLNELRTIRNKIAHQSPSLQLMGVSENDARSYVQVALDLIRYVEGLQRTDRAE
ncbi:MAG: hypothetical protein U1E29_09100 [Coriobacteriia bacterium]|nr:hypothetical protein [Coriobacteriia bacterium]